MQFLDFIEKERCDGALFCFVEFWLDQFTSYFLAAIPALATILRGHLPEQMSVKELPSVALASRCSKKANPQAGTFTTIGAENSWLNSGFMVLFAICYKMSFYLIKSFFPNPNPPIPR